jgi:hypothetical protein
MMIFEIFLQNNTASVITATCSFIQEELDDPAVRFGMRSRKLSNVGESLNGRPKIYHLEQL